MAKENLAENWEEMAASGSGEPSNLSQDDVDNLFGGNADDGSNDLRGVELLIDKALALHVRMPMLDVIYDRFVRICSSSLRNFTSSNVDVDIDRITPIRFGDFVESTQVPTIIAVVKSIEWDNYLLVVVDSQLTYSFVDILFGGRKLQPSIRVEGRPFTTIEQSISQSIVELLLKDLEVSFEQVTGVTFQLDRIEVNPRFATISRPEDVGIMLRLNVNIEGRTGKIDIFIPFATLEPVKKILSKSFLGERGTKDPTWGRHIQDEIANARVNLEVYLNGKSSTIGDILNLKVGDTIVLDIAGNDDLTLKIADLKISSGKLGKIDDKMAIQLSEGIEPRQLKG